MDKEFGFKKTVWPFGSVTPEDKISFSFELIDGLTGDDIEWIETSCGCTNVKWDDEANSIVGELDMARAGNYQEDVTAVNKTFTIVYNDGQRRYIADKDKKRITNKDKKIQVLSIAGQVVKE